MAQEGLFFTGTVLKNNRNLLQEEAVRQQLEMRREQLELQKQAAADRRKEARKKNQPSPLSFDSSSMGPEMGRIFQNDVLSYQKNLAGMSEGIINQDSEAINQRYDSESGLKTEKVVFDEVWKEVSSNRELARGNNRDSLGTNEEGGYIFEDNYQSFLDAVDQGVNPSDALEQFPISQGAINETKFENPANALYATEATNREYKEEKNGYEVKYVSKAQFDRVGKKIVGKLTPDKNGDWDDPAYKKMYLGQEGLFTVDNVGNLSGPEAFAMETEGIGLEPGDTTFTDKLVPGSDTYDPELANNYIQYLKGKMESSARKDYPGVRGSVVSKGDDKDAGLSPDVSKILLGDAEKTKSFGEVNIKFSPSQYDDLTNENIKVSLSPEALIQEQGSDKLEEFNTALQVWNSDNTGMDAEGKVRYIGITESNQPVAAVDFSGQMYLIPLASLSSSVKKKIKTAGGRSLDLFKIAEGGVTTESSTGVGSKYNKPT